MLNWKVAAKISFLFKPTEPPWKFYVDFQQWKLKRSLFTRIQRATNFSRTSFLSEDESNVLYRAVRVQFLHGGVKVKATENFTRALCVS